MTTEKTTNVDVLVVGGGAAGLTAAMLLAEAGVDFLLVSHHPGTSPLPKAHVLFQKTMEIFAELGIADAVTAFSTPPENMRYNAWYAGLAQQGGDWGRQITRVEAWGVGNEHNAWRDASPRVATNLPQVRLEPIMKARADALAPNRIRFNHTLTGVTQQAESVDAQMRDRASGETYTVRAKYLLACDGGRTVGPAVGVALEGPPKFGNTVGIHFTADLSRWTNDDPEVLIRVIKDPESGDDVVLVPMGPHHWGTRCTEWSCGLGFPPDVEMSNDEAVARIRHLLGVPDDLEMKIHHFTRWAMEGLVADRLRVGRVFLLGDAAHRHPPTGGLGLNTAVQDAYNLCWKLAAVLKGQAGEALLDSYVEEREPIARLVVETALQNAMKLFMFAQVVGFGKELSAEQRWANLRQLWNGGTPEAEAARRRFFEFYASTRPEFDSLNVTFGYTYQSSAVLPDAELPLVRPETACIYQPTTVPGASVPASELRRFGETSSIEQLSGHGRWLLVTGDEGHAWRAAGEQVARELGLPLDVVTIGDYECDWVDWRFDWTKKREVSAKGAVLVRPDRFVAWRSMKGSRAPATDLKAALVQVLALPAAGAATR